MPNRRHSRLKLAPGCCAKAKNSCRKVMVEHSCQGMFSSSKGLHAIVNCVTHVYGHLLPMSPVYTLPEGEGTRNLLVDSSSRRSYSISFKNDMKQSYSIVALPG